VFFFLSLIIDYVKTQYGKVTSWLRKSDLPERSEFLGEINQEGEVEDELAYKIIFTLFMRKKLTQLFMQETGQMR